MKISYNDAVTLVKECWQKSGLKPGEGKSVAFNALRTHLQIENLEYSHEEAVNWLNKNKELWPKQKYFQCRRAVFELNDVILHGKIVGNYIYNIDPFDLLPTWLKELILCYKDFLSVNHQRRAIRTQVSECIDFAMYLSEQWINCSAEITGLIITKYFWQAVTQGKEYVCTYSVRHFLEFLGIQGTVPVHLSRVLTAPIQARRAHIVFSLTVQDIEPFIRENIKESYIRLSAEDFFIKAELMMEYLEANYHYDADGLRNNYKTHLQMYYIFASEYHLDYTPILVQRWMSVVNIQENFKLVASRRRCFVVFDMFVTSGSISIPAPLCKQGGIELISECNRSLLHDYLEYRKAEGLAQSSLKHQKSAGVSLLLFLEKHGVMNLSSLTPELIKEYNVYVARASSNGKNNYAGAIRGFITFLCDKGLASEPLMFALPSKSGISRNIGDVLNDEEIKRIYEFRRNSKTPLELRHSAIILLGLQLGLRSADILNLKLSDIHWNIHRISIIQQKTLKSLTLPLPAAVGNSIYCYLKQGRPSTSQTNYIFISHRAPFQKLNHSACSDALQSVLGSQEHSFHCTRRTFATRLLNAGISTDTIADSLGHSTTDTVSRYLSLSDSGMRECCLPLKRTVK